MMAQMLYHSAEEENITTITTQPEEDSSMDCTSSLGCSRCCDNLDPEIKVCWEESDENATQRKPCPGAEFFQGNFEGGKFAYKTCFPNGTWNLTDYSSCQEKGRLPQDLVHNVTVVQLILSGISLFLLLIALYVFCTFRSIQCSRLSVHKNLVTALIIFYVVNIIVSVPYAAWRITFDESWIYNLLLSLMAFAQMSYTNWFFNEGFYLHSRITTSIFDSEAPFPFFHSIGWGLSGVCVSLWMLANYLTYGFDSHWRMNGQFIWILAAPMTIVLLVNLVFLINIVRILVTKLRASSTPEADQISSPVIYLTGLQIARPQPARRGRFVFPHGTDRMTALFWWKAMKAVGVLFGFLGFSNIVFSYNPKDKAFWESAYFVTNAILKSLHGIVVSTLYCFCSPDVRLAWAKKRYRMKVRWHSRNLRRDNSKRFRQSQRGLSEASAGGTVNFLRASGLEESQLQQPRDNQRKRMRLHQQQPFGPQGENQPDQGSTNVSRQNAAAPTAQPAKKSNGHTLKVWIHSAPSEDQNLVVKESSV